MKIREQNRDHLNDISKGIRSFIDLDTYRISIFNPANCSEKRFEKETGINLNNEFILVDMNTSMEIKPGQNLEVITW